MSYILAKVNRDEFPVGTVTAFGGMEITAEGIPVSIEFLEEIKVHPYLTYEIVEDEDESESEEEELDISPAALSLAEEFGISDLSEIQGTGAGGKIIKTDIEEYLESEYEELESLEEEE